MSRSKRPREDEPGATQIVRCKKCTGPTLSTIFKELDAKHEEWLDSFEHNCQSYGWDGCGCCKYFETKFSDELGSSAYCQTHGAESLGPNISHFFGYFVPRKMCTPSMSQMKKATAALRALVKHCVKKKYCDAMPEVLKEISVSANFDANKIRESLESLARCNYWDTLEEAATSSDHDDNDSGCSDYERILGTDCGMPLEISKMRQDGWELMDMDFGDASPDEDYDSTAFVRLPPEVAALGRVGAPFSCMSLGLRNGVWRPIVNEFDSVVANVYPP